MAQKLGSSSRASRNVASRRIWASRETDLATAAARAVAADFGAAAGAARVGAAAVGALRLRRLRRLRCTLRYANAAVLYAELDVCAG